MSGNGCEAGKTVWSTPGVSDRLVEMRASGASFAVIAAQLSTEFGLPISRSAVAGRVGRWALARPAQAAKPHGGWRSRKEKDTRPAPEMRNTEIVSVSAATEAILQVGDGCRFPFGDPRRPDFAYCGCRRKEKSSYCDRHHAVVYTQPEARPDSVRTR